MTRSSLNTVSILSASSVVALVAALACQSDGGSEKQDREAEPVERTAALTPKAADDRPGASQPATPPTTPPLHWAISSNDNVHVLVDGVMQVARNPAPDTIAIIDLSADPPKLAHELAVPGSVIGPPMSVAIAPDESLALVTSPMKIDPNDPTKAVADDRISVIDLTSNPPSLAATLHAGKQPSGVSISPDGKLALVANRGAGSISVLGIDGKDVRVVDTLALSDPSDPAQKPQTAHVAIGPDSKVALATNDGDHRISVLSIDGTQVSVTGQIYAGLKPYSIDIAPDGKFAVVGNVGFSSGDADTVSLIDLEVSPPRVVQTLSVGPSPEGIAISPDGSVVAVVLQNGSNLPESSPHHSKQGKLVLLRVENKTLQRQAEAPTGGWGQGAAFTSDSRKILVSVMIEKEIEVFERDGNRLVDTGTRIALGGGGAAIRTAER